MLIQVAAECCDQSRFTELIPKDWGDAIGLTNAEPVRFVATKRGTITRFAIATLSGKVLHIGPMNGRVRVRTGSGFTIPAGEIKLRFELPTQTWPGEFRSAPDALPEAHLALNA